MTENRFVVIISANIEWQVIQTIFPEVEIQSSSLGQWFEIKLEVRGRAQPVLFFMAAGAKLRRRLQPST